MENKAVLVFSGSFSVLSERQSVPFASVNRASPLSRQQPESAVLAAHPVVFSFRSATSSGGSSGDWRSSSGRRSGTGPRRWRAGVATGTAAGAKPTRAPRSPWWRPLPPSASDRGPLGVVRSKRKTDAVCQGSSEAVLLRNGTTHRSTR